jgi:hypothetical protein
MFPYDPLYYEPSCLPTVRTLNTTSTIGLAPLVGILRAFHIPDFLPCFLAFSARCRWIPIRPSDVISLLALSQR